jgi:hypothetical protein
MKRIRTPEELRRIWDPYGLHERISWVLKWRHETIGGNGTAWSLKAGVNKSQIVSLQDRLIKKPRFTPECRTMAALARAAEVPAGWLAFGEGTAEGYAPSQNGSGSAYPNLVRAINVATLVGDEILADTIEEARKIVPGFPRDRTILEWLDDIRDMDDRRRRARQEEHRKIVDETEPKARTHPASASYKSAKGRDDDS